MKFDRTSVTSAITLHLRTKRLLPLSKYLPKHVRKGSTRGRAHHAYRGLLIAVPIRRSLAAQKATGGKLVPPSPRCYRHGDSWDDDSVAADKSNVYCQRRSIDAANDASEDTYDADNSRRYVADTAKTKAEADKEVGGGDAKVSD